MFLALISLILLAFVVALSSGSATADESPTPNPSTGEPGAQTPTTGASESPWLPVLADYLGVSEAEAAARVATEGAFTDVVTEVQAKYPASYVGAEWRQDHGVIFVTDEAGKSVAQDVTAATKVPISVEVVAGLGAQANTELALKAISILQPVLGEDFQLSVDSATGVVSVTLPADSRKTDSVTLESEAAALLQGAGLEIASAKSALSVEITIGADAPQFYYEGGETYGSGCTGGFIAYRSGYAGVLTAKHCTENITSYDGATVGATTPAATGYDLRFRRLSSGTPTNQIRTGNVGPTYYSSVTSTGSISLGISVCKWGWSTGYTCGTTSWSTTGCIVISGVSTCGLYGVTPATFAAGGDSGGPVISGGKALASITGGDSTYVYVTPTTYINQISGTVTIKTS